MQEARERAERESGVMGEGVRIVDRAGEAQEEAHPAAEVADVAVADQGQVGVGWVGGVEEFGGEGGRGGWWWWWGGWGF